MPGAGRKGKPHGQKEYEDRNDERKLLHRVSSWCFGMKSSTKAATVGKKTIRLSSTVGLDRAGKHKGVFGVQFSVFSLRPSKFFYMPTKYLQ